MEYIFLSPIIPMLGTTYTKCIALKCGKTASQGKAAFDVLRSYPCVYDVVIVGDVVVETYFDDDVVPIPHVAALVVATTTY